MIKNLYLVRHGETEFNEQGIIQGGGLDSPLTAKGVLQAERLASYLKNNNFIPEKILSSPQERAFNTARILASGLNIPIELDNLLKEIDCGSFEGKLISSIDSEKLTRLRISAKEKYPDGESVEDVIERGSKLLQKFSSLQLDSCLIISHGNFLRSFACAATGMSSELAMKLYLDNTGFSYLFESGEYYRISLWNSCTHFNSFPRKLKN
ncbi:MAG: histidine phosphatase family protein [Leptospiraceae bacterium]|nr:histidine phosphatase family protein [Leptospiraceae bacterium]